MKFVIKLSSTAQTRINQLGGFLGGSLIFTCIVFYPLFSFMEWSLNPADWAYATRAIWIILFILIAVLQMFIPEETTEEATTFD